MTPIPYDEMRRLCGLPDIRLLAALDWARRQSGLVYLSYRDSGGIVREEFTLARDGTRVKVERDREVYAFASGLEEVVASTLKEVAEVANRMMPILDAMADGMRPKQSTPMWVRDPSKTHRTAFRSSRRVK